MTRKQRAAEALALRGQGLLHREIAGRMGISTSYAAALCSDPTGDGDRARKARYAGPCVDCGGPTNGSDGRRDEPRCIACSNIRNSAARRVWTREAIIAAIRAWADENGEPPAIADWNPSLARGMGDAPRAERFIAADGRWPWFMTAVREFGSWNAAISAAGFEPRPAGGGGGSWKRHRHLKAAYDQEDT